MRIVLNGASGRMGRMVKEASQAKGYSIVAEVSPDFKEDKAAHQYASLAQVTEEADVLIDFSYHTAASKIAEFITLHQMPAVIGTTGQTDEENAVLQKAAESVPVFRSGNMSLGIAVLSDLVKTAVRMFPDADVEIVEKHHNQKLDVPSGTALMLADAVKEVRPNAVYNIGRHENGKRKKEEIGIHSLRMGNETGTHEVYINTGNECLVLTHQAQSRAVFADGALKAAEFLVDQPAGMYSMKELLAQ